MILIVIATALIPALVLGWWIYRKDAVRPEPLRMLFKAFLYGVGSTFVTLVIVELLKIIGLFTYDFQQFDNHQRDKCRIAENHRTVHL